MSGNCLSCFIKQRVSVFTTKLKSKQKLFSLLFKTSSFRSESVLTDGGPMENADDFLQKNLVLTPERRLSDGCDEHCVLHNDEHVVQ